MVKALIIDDEEQSLILLKSLIKQHIPEITQIEVATGGQQGLSKIETFKPDLLFLDIEMPIMSGFDLLKKVKEWSFGIIFTTAFNKYAIRAIKFSALDYLLKPINPQELKTAFKIFLNHKTTLFEKNELYKNLLDNVSRESELFKLTLPTKKGFHFFELPKIIRLESSGNYSIFHFQKRTKLIVAKTLKEYSDILSDHGFIRIHKSHLANRIHIKSYISSGKVELSDGLILDISRRRKASVKKILGI